MYCRPQYINLIQKINYLMTNKLSKNAYKIKILAAMGRVIKLQSLLIKPIGNKLSLQNLNKAFSRDLSSKIRSDKSSD